MPEKILTWLVALAIFVAGDNFALPAPRDLRVITFNIQFLGNFQNRRDEDLADMLAPYDLVIVQELVAPPYVGAFPDGSSFAPDPEAAKFFDAMAARNFQYVLSEEDTGTGPRNHLNSAATEWFVAFYKQRRVNPATDLFTGFIADDGSNNRDYERVPYAFAFRTGNADLVFISVHLQPGGETAETARRAQELELIFSWIEEQDGEERDYVILGDMNIENCVELESVLADSFASLNHACQATNTNPRSGKPYDHIMYRENESAEINTRRGITVLNLVEEMKLRWPRSDGRFPGDPYVHDEFRTRYSDHHPVLFSIRIGGRDDD